MSKSASSETSVAQRLNAEIDGYRIAALAYAAIKLDLPDKMDTRGWTAAQLACEATVSVSRLSRLLRALTAIGLCDEQPRGTFFLSEAGQQLKSDSAHRLREKTIVAIEQYWPAWSKLSLCLKNEQTAYEQHFGMSPWQYRRENPGVSQAFNAHLAKETALATESILKMLDFTSVNCVADIGGGDGGLLLSVLEYHPQLTGILFDQPHVIEQARTHFASSGHRAKFELLGGDFFSEIPLRADIFFLKSVLHDWADAETAVILANCRSAMSGTSRLLIIERILPEEAAEDISTLMLDIHMMAVTGGQERSLAEFEFLLRQQNFGILKITPSHAGFSIIEAVPT